ncbi:hypothetical protein B0T20DRAFT_484316 [Sordaria brevicollis]|uniref:Uncharacterized protein n=1 Tax=Sordaria brevicollis TaxID=83679 RepID=A0AAE0U2N0_SORBR|nr:hypothetical protein B0T20DRAFT_484316 [Sordaria brevicollis]
MSDLPPSCSSLGTTARHRKSFLRTICSRTLHINQNEDAITPCPVEPSAAPSTSHDNYQQPSLSRSPSSSSLLSTSSTSSSLRSSSDHNYKMTRDFHEIDTQLLWRRMLAIQRTFGCYNSTRMNIAIEMGVENASVPSRVCLDLLNDSIDTLPSEIKQRIEDFLACEDVSSSRSRSKSSSSRRSSTSCRGSKKWSWRHLLHA